MSGDDDTENAPEASVIGGEEEDDDDDEVVHAANNQDLNAREENYDSNNSNEDGVMVNTDNNGSGGDSDGVVVSEDAGREDMFLDAPEDLGADGRESSATLTEAQGSTDGEEDSGHVQRMRFRGLDNEMQNDYMVDEMERLRAMLDKTVNEKESMAREHKDEMEMAAKGIANLRDQLRNFTNKQLLVDDNQFGYQNQFHADADHVPLHDTIHECSMFLRSVMEEVQDLNTKSTEAAVSREVVSSYMNSVQNESAEVQLQKDQYMEDVTNRMLGSFASLVYVGDLTDYSGMGKIAHVEKSLYSLIENYNWFLYQSDQLRQCLTEVRPDLAEQTDFGLIFAAANDELLGFRKKEADSSEKLSYMVNENSELKEQLEKHKALAETANAELERLKAELDQEKHRYGNTKEKLSLAVTKGKALVQQRDSLKQVVADKTSELENCLAALKEKSSALEAAELIKEEWVKCQISVASLREEIVKKDLVLEKLEDVLVQSGVPEGLNSKDVTEKLMWLVDERNALKDVSLKFHQLADALLSIDLPETFSFSDIESRLSWLTKAYDEAKIEIGTLQDEVNRTTEALNQAKAEIGALQDENVRIKEDAQCEVDHLSASLSTVLVEKDYIGTELEDMSDKIKVIVQREQHASSEKEQILRILLEASGVPADDRQPFETATLVEQCLATLKEQSSLTNEASEGKEEIIQKLQCLLYVREQDLVLHEKLLEEETQKTKLELDKLYSDLRIASEELTTLKEQNENLKKDLERTEDKSALIREKLSMAVKKGKGLVQDREGLKQLIDEKNSEIEKLKLELKQRESEVNDYKSESSRLSTQVEGMAKLEEDLLVLKDERDQLERDLMERNKLMHAVMESINSIALPADSSLEEPLEKVKQLAGYLSECEAAKAQAEQQLEKAVIEVETLTTTVSEAQISIKSLEDALVVAEEKFSQLTEEKTELEVAQASAQQQLQIALQEASLFAEADVAKKALENALALAESNVSRLDKEKEVAESSRASTEAELDEAKSEIAVLTAELSKATANVKALEETVSHLETRIGVLSDETNEVQIGRAKLENELTKVKEEADTWDSKLQDAHSSIRFLEDALGKAENDISEMSNEKKAAEQEISTVSAKLNACLEELAGTHGSLESRSLELFDHLKGLELLGEDESILSSLRRCCETKVESLKEMEGLFRNIRGHFAKMAPEIDPVTEEPSRLTKVLSASLDDILGSETATSSVGAIDSNDISVYTQKIVESFHTRKNTFAEKIDGFLSFVNESNASVMQELLSTSKSVTPVVQQMNSLNERMKIMENKVTALEDDVSALLSACSEATQVLEFEVDKWLTDASSTPEYEAEHETKLYDSKHVKEIKMLLSASRKVSSVCEQFEISKSSLSSTNEELQNSLNELKVTAKKAMEDRDLNSNKVREVETDLATLQDTCSELRLKLEKYQDLEARLRDRDTEISSLQNNLVMKEREAGEALFWASHAKTLLERANKIQVSLGDSLIRDLEPQDSAQIDKLVYIIDNFPELQGKVESLSHEKAELQTALSAQLHETEHLKERDEQELAKVRSKIADMEAGLDRIIQKFSSRDIAQNQKFVTVDDLVQVLEKLVMAVILESESLKSKAHDLELEVEKSINAEQELTKLKGQILDLEVGIQKNIKNLRGELTGDQKPVASSDLIQVLGDLVTTVTFECENLKSKAHVLDSEIKKSNIDEELAEVKGELSDLETGLKRIIQRLRGDATGPQTFADTSNLLQLLEKTVMTLIMESENSKSRVRELDSKLLGSQNAVNELLLKNKILEDSVQSRGVSPDTVQERGIFEAPSQPSTSEISEIEDVGSITKPAMAPVPSSTLRTMRKSSSDHIALNIDSETTRLVDTEEAVEDKGHVFKSLNTSGLVPKQGKMIADRIDGIWVSGGRLLMKRPQARLGLIAYWLFLHLWLLGTIL